MKYYTDGFTIGPGNPCPLGGGYTIVDETNKLVKRESFDRPMTNNEAEILGIVECLRLAVKGDCVSTDSMCCLSWVNSGKSKARPDLNLLLVEANCLRYEKEINLLWERREFNLAGIYNEKNPERPMALLW